MVPLLRDPKTRWPDRILVHHVGRWPTGKAAESKYHNCSIQNAQFTLVGNKELYDLKNDPGEKTNVFSQYPDVVSRLQKAYDQWWSEALPLLVNEDSMGPEVNPMKAVYWKQFGGGPDARMLKKMDPKRKFSDFGEE
jgi:arylsulfatase